MARISNRYREPNSSSAPSLCCKNKKCSLLLFTLMFCSIYIGFFYSVVDDIADASNGPTVVTDININDGTNSLLDSFNGSIEATITAGDKTEGNEDANDPVDTVNESVGDGPLEDLENSDIEDGGDADGEEATTDENIDTTDGVDENTEEKNSDGKEADETTDETTDDIKQEDGGDTDGEEATTDENIDTIDGVDETNEEKNPDEKEADETTDETTDQEDGGDTDVEEATKDENIDTTDGVDETNEENNSDGKEADETTDQEEEDQTDVEEATTDENIDTIDGVDETTEVNNSDEKEADETTDETTGDTKQEDGGDTDGEEVTADENIDTIDGSDETNEEKNSDGKEADETTDETTNDIKQEDGGDTDGEEATTDENIDAIDGVDETNEEKNSDGKEADDADETTNDTKQEEEGDTDVEEATTDEKTSDKAIAEDAGVVNDKDQEELGACESNPFSKTLDKSFSELTEMLKSSRTEGIEETHDSSEKNIESKDASIVSSIIPSSVLREVDEGAARRSLRGYSRQLEEVVEEDENVATNGEDKISEEGKQETEGETLLSAKCISDPQFSVLPGICGVETHIKKADNEIGDCTYMIALSGLVSKESSLTKLLEGSNCNIIVTQICTKNESLALDLGSEYENERIKVLENVCIASSESPSTSEVEVDTVESQARRLESTEAPGVGQIDLLYIEFPDSDSSAFPDLLGSFVEAKEINLISKGEENTASESVTLPMQIVFNNVKNTDAVAKDVQSGALESGFVLVDWSESNGEESQSSVFTMMKFQCAVPEKTMGGSVQFINSGFPV